MRKLILILALLPVMAMAQSGGPGGIPSWLGWGTDPAEACVYVNGDTLYADSLIKTITTLATNGIFSGPLSADSIEADHWTGVNAVLSAFLDVDSIHTGKFTIDTYTQYHCVEAGGASLGPTAPTWATNGTMGGLAFDADAEEAFLRFSVPDDWDGSSDMTLNTSWSSERGDDLADGETVVWLISYRSIVWGTEGIENGTLVADSVTYTQSGAGSSGQTIISSLVIDYDNTDQPLTVGDCILIKISRHVGSDTYSGDAIVAAWKLSYNSTGIPIL